MISRRRVAITGIGLVTPVGNDVPAVWKNLVAGRSGVAPIRGFDASGFPARIGAEVKEFDFEAAIPDRKLAKFASRPHRFALAAAREALVDAGIRPDESTAHRWGFCAGAGMMGVPFHEVEKAHAACARDGEFNPDGFVNGGYAVDPVAFCRSQSNADRKSVV